MLPNAIAIANGKGGVGKTSLTANVGGVAAAAGWRVLLVDLDPQGNLAGDLGVLDSDGYDDGEGLLSAVCEGVPLRPEAGARPHLDLVAAGRATEILEDEIRERVRLGDVAAPGAVDEALRPVAEDYDLILLDCPPATGTLIDLAFTAARFVLVPTRGDQASLHGLTRTADRFLSVRRSSNPALDLLGVVLFGFGVNDTRLVGRARSQLEEALAGIAPVFPTFVRHGRRVPEDMREAGLLAIEHAAAGGPDGIARDYERLTSEILAAFKARRGVRTAA